MSRKRTRTGTRRRRLLPSIVFLFLFFFAVVAASPFGHLESPAVSSVAGSDSASQSTGSATVQATAVEAVETDTAATVSEVSVPVSDVTLPDGTFISSNTKRVDLSGLSSGDVSAVADSLSHLADVMVIDLGTSSLTGADLAALHSAAPDARFTGTVSINGSSISTRATSIDLTGLSHDAVADTASALSVLSHLEYIELGDSSSSPSLTWEDIGTLEAAAPNAVTDYHFSFYDKTYSTADKVFNLSYITMTDRGEAVRNMLPYMTSCKYLDMDTCGISNEDMATLRSDFPGMKVVWRINWGENNIYSARTDVIKILASKPSVGGVLTTADVQCISYCTDLMYLDLGHNDDIDDISFISTLPRLQVCIIAMDFFEDLSPIAACTNLEYLEIQTTYVKDLSPLAGLTKLHNLNICNLENVTDFSPLYNLKNLERLWIGCHTPCSDEQLSALQANLPDCNINTEVDDPTTGQWRMISWDIQDTGVIVYNERYVHLRDQFGYTYPDRCYSFNYCDPRYKEV